MLMMQVMCLFRLLVQSVMSLSSELLVEIFVFQKFAHDKMEWPKHYTSEKVLVLMTYAELMNRKYGREMSSQVKPLR